MCSIVMKTQCKKIIAILNVMQSQNGPLKCRSEFDGSEGDHITSRQMENHSDENPMASRTAPVFLRFLTSGGPL